MTVFRDLHFCNTYLLSHRERTFACRRSVISPGSTGNVQHQHLPSHQVVLQNDPHKNRSNDERTQIAQTEVRLTSTLMTRYIARNVWDAFKGIIRCVLYSHANMSPKLNKMCRSMRERFSCTLCPELHSPHKGF